MSHYRGVCLLSLAISLIAGVFASILRTWAETIGAMDENYNGFRGGGARADAT